MKGRLGEVKVKANLLAIRTRRGQRERERQRERRFSYDILLRDFLGMKELEK